MRRCTTSGKEVLVDGKHFADGASEDVARVIAISLEYAGLPSARIPAEDAEVLKEFWT